MPELAVVNLRQWCVVWFKSDVYDRHGQPRLADPVNVKCRWVTSDSESPTQDQTRESYTMGLPVDRAIPLGSIVWGQGKIADLPASPQYWEVISASTTPDIKAKHPAYNITIQKASKTLPELA